MAVTAVALARGSGFGGALPLLLALAPVVPVTGVALSYGRYSDPAFELTASTPSGGLRLLLVRSAAVLVVSVPLLTVAGLLLPTHVPPPPVTRLAELPDVPGLASWLLPGLVLTLASLALAGYIGCRAATAVVGGGWLLAVLAPTVAADGPWLSGRLPEQLSLYFNSAPAQTGWAAGAALCTVLLAVRRTAYDRLETM
jgi:hypothetical protein